VTDLIRLMAAPFVACVVLVGIHAYLGMHVIQRKVIFVDLALAQIAALGATFGFLLGLSPHDAGAHLFALGFAIVGAAIFAATRMRHERIPQEAIIGIVYVVALATAILVADRAPEGAEHIKETLVGAILWVTWPTVGRVALIYVVIGAIHVALRRRFHQISFDPERAYAEGRWVRLWDFVFYVTFAFVITLSVSIAGVLLVFTFLVIPAVIATLFARRISVRLGIGWGVGIAASLVGMVASYRFDMPSGPAVVASFGVALLLAALLSYVVHAERRRHALLRVAATVAVAAGVLAGFGIFATSGRFAQIEHEHEWETEPAAPLAPDHTHEEYWTDLKQQCGADLDCMADHLREHDNGAEHLARELGSESVEAREEAIDVAGRLVDGPGADLLAEAAEAEPDPLLRIQEVQILADAGDRRGLALAVNLLGDDSPPLVRDEAHQLLQNATGKDFGYDPFADAAGNAEALAAWRRQVGEAQP